MQADENMREGHDDSVPLFVQRLFGDAVARNLHPASVTVRFADGRNITMTYDSLIYDVPKKYFDTRGVVGDAEHACWAADVASVYWGVMALAIRVYIMHDETFQERVLEHARFREACTRPDGDESTEVSDA